MSRRKKTVKREIPPDPVYKNLLVTKFINRLMLQGKRSVAEKIFYSAMDIVTERTNENPLDVFIKAMDNVRPILEIKSRRVGGATYQVPIEVHHLRKTTLAIRWIIGFAKARPGKTMSEKLAGEIISAYKGEGASMKKREDTHRMAEANKAFAHFRW